MTAAVRHLLDLGHRDFALVTGGPALPARDLDARRSRRRCGRAAVVARSSRERLESRVAIGGPCRRSTARRCPTALIAAGNTLMAGAIRALHELGIQIGSDISFVGCDNVLVAELHQPPIAVAYRRRWRPRHGRGEHVAQCAEHEPPRFARRGHGAADRVHGQAQLRPATGPIALESDIASVQRDEGGVDELVGEQVEQAVEVGDAARLAELVDADGHDAARRTRRRARPGGGWRRRGR